LLDNVSTFCFELQVISTASTAFKKFLGKYLTYLVDSVAMNLDHQVFETRRLFVVVLVVYLFEVFLDLEVVLEMVLYKPVIHVVVKHLYHLNV
jgi:hypothetical protein